ncbi:MAG: DNA gyrase inhibitor YacG [bacterium]
MKIKCPQCKKETEWENNPFRPFCSERCKLIDLGYWFEERYSLLSEDEAGSSETEEN